MTSVEKRTNLIQHLEKAHIELRKVNKWIDKLEYHLYLLDETNMEPPDCEQCARPRCVCQEDEEDEEEVEYEEVEYVG